MSTLSGGPNIVTDGLVLNLDAANIKSYVSGSTTWRDLSRGGNNGTLVNGPTYSSTNGGSIVFDGVDDYSQILDNPSLNFGLGNFTINCWIRILNPNANFNFILSKHSNPGSAGSEGVGFFLSPHNTASGNVRTYIRDSNNIGGLIDGPPGQNLRDGNWKNVSFILNRQSNSYTVINNFYGNPVNLSSMGNISNNTSLFLGGGGGGFSLLNIQYSIIQLYNRALSAQEILQNYNSTKSRFGL